ncbi:MAG TPA: ATP-binding protein [Azospirillaceae bacterium]|nr:ATP-binding protein [Azospirillaceae bacterium]
MVSAATPLRRPKRPTIDPPGILNALPTPVMVVDRRLVVQYLNLQGEAFFEGSAATLVGMPLEELLPSDSPVFSLIGQVLDGGNLVSLDGVTIHTPRFGPYFVNIQAGLYGEGGERVVMTLQERSIARMIDNQMTHRHAARSVTAMAAMLAHEVKNPLSGIRGAAQLLDETVPEEDRVLTGLIRDEADRIVALVNRMEVFSDGRPLERVPVNIHAVLDHVRNVAQNGWARPIRFVENYDPSLPPVYGNRDQLIQVFLNLVKNAAEACPEQGGEIVLSTSYQHSMRVTVPGTEGRLHLPLLVSVQDNGEGIPEDLYPHLFDPFVTTKRNGTGLGLALVAKIIGDHGGVIEFDSLPRRTVFKVSLPMYEDVELPAATTNGPSRELA